MRIPLTRKDSLFASLDHIADHRDVRDEEGRSDAHSQRSIRASHSKLSRQRGKVPRYVPEWDPDLRSCTVAKRPTNCRSPGIVDASSKGAVGDGQNASEALRKFLTSPCDHCLNNNPNLPVIKFGSS